MVGEVWVRGGRPERGIGRWEKSNFIGLLLPRGEDNR